MLSSVSERAVVDVRELANDAGQTQVQQDLVDCDSQLETKPHPAPLQLADTRPIQGAHSAVGRSEGRQTSDSLAIGLPGDSQEASPVKNKKRRRDDPVSPSKVRRVLNYRLAAMAN